MQAPLRSDEEALSNATFDAVLNALAWPGSTRRLPETGFGGVISALIDRECSIYTSDDLLTEKLLHTGARAVMPDEADHVFCTGDELSQLAEQFVIGSDYYPDDGATVIASAQIGAGQRLRLTGPGIDGAIEIRIGGIDRDFWHIRAARIRYPVGFELVIVDGDMVLGIPRSTQLEIV